MTSQYVCLINNYLSTSCTRSTTDLVINPSITLNSGTLYHIKISSNNGITDGLNTPSISGFKTVYLKSYIGVPKQDEGFIDIPISSSFSELSGKLFVQGSGNPSLLQLNIKILTSISAGVSGSIIVNFPVYDFFMSQTQFSTNIGTSQVDGTYYPCELFTIGPKYVPVAGVTCMLKEGYYTSSLTKPTSIKITFPGSLSSGTSIIIGFPGITVPSTSRGSDIIVYTQELSGTNIILRDYQILRHVYYTHNVNTLTYISQAFPSISNAKIMSTGNTYTFSFQPVLPVQTTDYMIFTAKTNQISITTATDSNLPYTFLFLYIKAG